MVGPFNHEQQLLFVYTNKNRVIHHLYTLIEVLKVILNRLKPQAEEIIAEEQAGFRAG